MAGERVEIELFLSLDQARRELSAFTATAKQQIAQLSAPGAASPAGISSLAQQVGSFRGQLQASKSVGNITEAEYARLNRQMIQSLGLTDFRNKLRGQDPQLLKDFDTEVARVARSYRNMANAAVIGTEQTATGVNRIVAAQGALGAALTRGAELEFISNEERARNILMQRAQHAAQERALRQALLQSGQLSFTQRLQVLGGSTNPQPLGQLLRSGITTTAKYAGSAALLYGGVSAVTNMVREAQVLEERFNLLSAELNAVGKGEQLEPLKRQIFDIARQTGVATEEVATLASTIGPAFEFDPQATATALDVATKVARLADVPATEIFNDLIAGARAFADTDPMGNLLQSQAEVLTRFADIGTAIRNLTGVSLKEFEDFIGRVAPSAQIAGFSEEAISGIGAALLQGSGLPGATLAEQFNRIITSFPEISLELADSVAEIPKLAEALGTVGFDKLYAGDASVLVEITQAVEGLTEAEKRMFLSRVGGRREGQTLSALFNNPQTLTNALRAAADSEGALDAEMQRRRETLAQQVRELGVAFTQFGQSLYDAGIGDILKDLVQVLQFFGNVINFVGDRLNGPIIGQISQLAIKLGELYLVAKALQTLGVLNLFGSAAGGAGAAAGGGLLARLLGRGGAGATGAKATQLALPGLEAAGAGGLLARVGTKTLGKGVVIGGTLLAADYLIDRLSGPSGPIGSIESQVENLDQLAKEFSGKSNAELERILREGTDSGVKGDIQSGKVEDELERRGKDVNQRFVDALKDAELIDDKAARLFREMFKTNTSVFRRDLGTGKYPDLEDAFVRNGGKYAPITGLDDEELLKFLKGELQDGKYNTFFKGKADQKRLAALGRKIYQQVVKEVQSGGTGAEGPGPVEQQIVALDVAIQEYENGERSYQKLLQNFAYRRQQLNRALAQGNKAAASALSEINKKEIGITDAEARRSYDLGVEVGQFTSGDDPRLKISGLQTLLSRTRDPDTRFKVAIELANAQQALVKQMVAEADSASEALQILQNGIPLDSGVRTEIIYAQLNDQYGAWQQFLASYTGIGLQVSESMTRTMALMISSGGNVLEFIRSQIQQQIDAANLAALYGGLSVNLSSINQQLAALDSQLANLDKLGGALGTNVPTTVTDPEAIDAQREKAANDARELAEAQADYAEALAGDSPIAAAEAAQRRADAAYANATNEAGRLRAQAERIRADRALQEAILDIYAAQSELLIALANAAGDEVEAARLGANEARRLLDIEKTKPNNEAAIKRAEANVVTAEASERDARFQDALDRQAFLHEMNEITTGQYIAYLEQLAQDPKLTEDQIREVRRTIKQLKGELGTDLQFNLPTELGLPTLYEARRINQQGGAGNYTDNRQVMIVVQGSNNPEVTAQAVYDKFNSAPRYGIQSRLY